MKALRANELRGLSLPELEQKRDAISQELLQLRLKARTVGVEKPAAFRRLRRDIARVLTIMNEQHTADSRQQTVDSTRSERRNA